MNVQSRRNNLLCFGRYFKGGDTVTVEPTDFRIWFIGGHLDVDGV